MIDNLPTYISLLFSFCTLATLFLFVRVIRASDTLKIRKIAGKITLILVFWLCLQVILSLVGIYSMDTRSIPPKILLYGILPTIVIITMTFVSQKGREFMDSLSLEMLLYIHLIRIPVELVLYLLSLYELVPRLITFSGSNFDILAGLTVPLMVYLNTSKRKYLRALNFIWNIISLGLLLNVVILAFLSAPSPLQRISFEQPNIAMLHFPFSWLPTFIVPIILFIHLLSIRRLLLRKP